MLEAQQIKHQRGLCQSITQPDRTESLLAEHASLVEGTQLTHLCDTAVRHHSHAAGAGTRVNAEN